MPSKTKKKCTRYILDALQMEEKAWVIYLTIFESEKKYLEVHTFVFVEVSFVELNFPF